MTSVTPIVPAFRDDRGEIIDIFEGVVHHTGLITFTPGAVRGNHYHREQTQYTYVLQGEIELRTCAADTPDAPVTTHLMRPGDFVTLPPHTIHAYRAVTAASMLCLTTMERGSADAYEQDTVRVPSLF
jgi:quercetin dioxygenase-like cupin family protein